MYFITVSLNFILIDKIVNAESSSTLIDIGIIYNQFTIMLEDAIIIVDWAPWYLHQIPSVHKNTEHYY